MEFVQVWELVKHPGGSAQDERARRISERGSDDIHQNHQPPTTTIISLLRNYRRPQKGPVADQGAERLMKHRSDKGICLCLSQRSMYSLLYLVASRAETIQYIRQQQQLANPPGKPDIDFS